MFRNTHTYTHKKGGLPLALSGTHGRVLRVGRKSLYAEANTIRFSDRDVIVKLKKLIAGAILTFYAISAHAITSPREYLSTVEKRDDGNPVAKLMINSYHLGIVQTVQAVVRLNGNKILLGENDPMCVPSARAVNGDSIEKAIALMIGTPARPQNLSAFENAPVALLAVYGLSRVFPCGGQENHK